MDGDSTAAQFAARLTSVADEIEAMLDGLLGRPSLPGEITRPARLRDAMRYASLGGGKRLRPFLLVETARLFGLQGEGPLRAGAALEMIHCYSLVHDDLPAMDDDDLRRGRPTAHKAFDEATAILAGDALLTYAFDVIGDTPTHPDPAVRAQLVVMLARAAGLGGMAGGQALDLEAEKAVDPHTAEAVLQLQAMKTGALLLFAVEAGAVMGGASDRERAALLRYGRALGAAFQVADDILDMESDAATLGKAAGKDAGRNKATLVSAIGIEAARARRDALAQEAQAALDDLALRSRTTTLAEAARFTRRPQKLNPRAEGFTPAAPIINDTRATPHSAASGPVMAGHSQFKNIMHKKGKQDAMRSKLFSKLAREITVAAKLGLPDPDMNARLRSAVLAARAENMPKDNIERAIKKASGADGENYDEVRYEGYAPGGVAVIIEALTDNRNRTAGEVRSYFTKAGGALAETGAVSFLWNRIGLIEYDLKAASEDAMMEAALEAGADDATTSEDGHEIVTSVEGLKDVAKAIEQTFGEPRRSALVWRPQNTIAVDDEAGEKILRLVGSLEDNDDVQRVYANFEVSDALVAKLDA